MDEKTFNRQHGGKRRWLRYEHFEQDSMGGNALEEARHVGDSPPLSDEEILFSFVMSCQDPVIGADSETRRDLTRLFHRALGSPSPADFEERVLEFLNTKFNVGDPEDVREKLARKRRHPYDDETRQ